MNLFLRRALAGFVVLALALLVTGCGASLVPFTQELRVQHNLKDDDVKNLQFYVSHRITLRREIEAGGSQITGNHKLLLLSGKTIEEVVIEEGTPGVALKVNDRSLAISFENGTSVEFATVGRSGAAPLAGFAEPPDPFPGNKEGEREPEPFAVGAEDGFGGRHWLAVDRSSRVPFQGKLFAPIDDSLKAHLLIDAEKLEEIVENQKVLRGVRLPSR